MTEAAVSRSLARLCVFTGIGLSALWGAAAMAQEMHVTEAPLRLELNRLEGVAENCRAYLLVDNAGGGSLRSLKLDLFALDTEGVAAKRIAVELGRVPAKKTLIRLFDFPGLACARVGRVLLNDVLSCEAADGPRENCINVIETSSKAGQVAFVK